MAQVDIKLTDPINADDYRMANSFLIVSLGGSINVSLYLKKVNGKGKLRK